MADKLFTEGELAWGFNEWTRRFIENPEDYAQQWDSIRRFLAEDNGDNNAISVGDEQAAYIVSLINE